MDIAVPLVVLASLMVIVRYSLVATRALPDHMDPRGALVLLGGSALLLATASTAGLALLVVAAAAQLPEIARLGEWSPAVLADSQPWALPIGALAAPVLVILIVRATAEAGRIGRRYWRVARELPAQEGVDGVIVLEDPAPYAVARPRLGRRPGHVVVSSGMLDGLDDDERRALVAHELAHLAGHHHVFATLAALAEVVNPLLTQLGGDVAYAAERCADEAAARSVGDRDLVARAVGRAALLAHRAGPVMPVVGLGMTSGPVPRRVGALLGPPSRRSRRWGLLATLMALAAGVAFGAAMYAGLDLHGLLEVAEYPCDAART